MVDMIIMLEIHCSRILDNKSQTFYLLALLSLGKFSICVDGGHVTSFKVTCDVLLRHWQCLKRMSHVAVHVLGRANRKVPIGREKGR